jgi:hypothetical protein
VRGAAGQALDLVDELLGVERLFDEVVGARAETLLVVVGLLLRRQNEHRDSRAFSLDLGAETVASLPIQRDVAEDDRRMIGAELGECSVGGVGRHDAVVLASEGHLQHFAHRDAIVDGEQGRGHGIVLLGSRVRRADHPASVLFVSTNMAGKGKKSLS